MGRIRSIKPETPKDEIFGKLPRDVRLLFILLWTVADDAGRFRASPTLIKAELFPYDDLTGEEIGGWLDLLDEKGRIQLYTVRDQQYGSIVNWKNHQKIDRPSTSRIPGFDEGSSRARRGLDEGSRPSKSATSTLLAFDEDSSSPSEGSSSGDRPKSTSKKRLESSASEIAPKNSTRARRGLVEGSSRDLGSRISTGDQDPEKDPEYCGTTVVASGPDSPTPPGARQFVEAFHRAFQARHDGAKPTWGAKQGAMVKELLRKHGVDECLRRLKILADGEGPSWLGEWDLGSFVAHFDKLASPAGGAGGNMTPEMIYAQIKRAKETENGQT